MRVLLLGCLFLLLATRPGRAEPLHPLRSAAGRDSLAQQLARSALDTTRVNLLLALSQDLLDRHAELATPLGAAATYSRQAAVLSQQLGYASGQVRSCYALGRALAAGPGGAAAGQPQLQAGLHLSQQLAAPPLEALGWYYLGEAVAATPATRAAALGYYQRALHLYQQLNDRPRQGYLLKALADVHLWQGRSLLALRELLQALALYQAAGTHRLHYTHDLLLVAHRELGDYQAALRSGLAAVESAQTTGDTLALGLFYSRVANVYEELNQPAESQAYYERALHHDQAARDTVGSLELSANLARLLLRQHQPRPALRVLLTAATPAQLAGPAARPSAVLYLAECYAALGRYPAAAARYRQLLGLVQQGADERELLDAYAGAGGFYRLSGRYELARAYLRRALRLADRLGPLPRVAGLHRQLFQVDSAQGRLLSAIAHYQRYKALTDSVFSAARSKQISSLQIQYDTRKKEQRIGLLTQQSQLARARLRQREWQRNATLVGAALLAGLLLLGYNRYRLRQRSLALLEGKQREINSKNESLELLLTEKSELLAEKEQMLTEIHHRVKNNLQIVSELLDSQTDQLPADGPALAILRDSQHRVQAMALVHQKLYQTRNLARVQLADYLRELTEYLLASLDGPGRVRPHLHLDPLELDVALATPVGLLLNEAITNVLKHAFKPGQAGNLYLELRDLGDHRYRLRVADDGRGLPPGFDQRRSMGLTMIRGLGKQLGATPSFTEPAGGGVALTLEFAVPGRPA